MPKIPREAHCDQFQEQLADAIPPVDQSPALCDCPFAEIDGLRNVASGRLGAPKTAGQEQADDRRRHRPMAYSELARRGPTSYPTAMPSGPEAPPTPSTLPHSPSKRPSKAPPDRFDPRQIGGWRMWRKREHGVAAEGAVCRMNAPAGCADRPLRSRISQNRRTSDDDDHIRWLGIIGTPLVQCSIFCGATCRHSDFCRGGLA